MSEIIPPTPVDQPQTSFEWVDWYEKLRKIVNETEFFHNSLQGLQGGTSAERYHLTLAEKTSVAAIANLDEVIDDKVASLLVAGTNITLTYDDGAGTLTIDATGGGSSKTRATVAAPAASYGETTVNVVDGTVTALSKIECALVLNSTTDANGAEELYDMAVFAIPNAGSIDFTITKPGPFVGSFYIDYSVV